MYKIFKKESFHLIVIIFVIGLVFFPALFGFFSGDDWAVMRVSQVNSFHEFSNFFLPGTVQSLTFFRPLPQQFFFFIFSRMFGLNSLPYYIFTWSCFLLSLYFLYRLARRLKFDHTQSALTVIFYGVAVANFARVYFLSAFQDVLLPLFAILTLLAYLNKKYFYSLVFFIFALLTKETAVVLPFLLLATLVYTQEGKKTKTIPFFVLLFGYLYLRLKFFGGATGDSYLWDFSVKKAVNTLLWYCLWAVGTPEIMVDYVGSGLKIVPRFFTDFPAWSQIILIELGSLFLSLFVSITLVAKEIIKKYRLIAYCLLVFLLSLSPVIFMPWHKFTHALSLPMVGTSLLMGYFFSKPNVTTKLFIILYLITNISMMFFLYPRFYSVNRGKISRLVYEYFSVNYPAPPQDDHFVFVNDPTGYLHGQNQSKEVALAISQSDFFKIIYRDPDYMAYFLDLPTLATPSGSAIYIDSGQFLRRY